MYSTVLFTKVLPEHIDDYIANMKICAEATNKEPGCIRYESMQDVDDPSMMCLLQIFEDEDAYQAHQDAEHHTHWIEISTSWRDLSGRKRHQMRFITPLSARAST